MYVVINSDPVIVFYRPQDSAPAVSGALYPLLIDAGPRRTQFGESPSQQITLNNSNGRVTTILSDPPLRAAATFYRIINGTNTTEIDGVLQSVALAEVAAITIES